MNYCHTKLENEMEIRTKYHLLSPQLEDTPHLKITCLTWFKIRSYKIKYEAAKQNISHCSFMSSFEAFEIEVVKV